ncbi:MAG: peptidoglycan-binding protein [Alphaproteobacteria bacterium]|nr:peptidoglycan-binding protein [Alphaproteobacteria bacterium]
MTVDPKAPEERLLPKPRLGPAADDTHFRDSIAAFSRELSERARQQAEVDPKLAAASRRAALQASVRARRRRFMLLAGLGSAGAVLVAVAGVIGVTFLDDSPLPTEAMAPSATPTVVATAAPAPPPAATPPAATTSPAVAVEASSAPAPDVTTAASSPPVSPPANPTATAPIVEAAPAQATTTAAESPKPTAPPETASPPAAPTPAAAPPATAAQVEPLPRRDIAEVQSLLQRFGFNPGPADGSVGPITRGAAMRYQQERGLAQTGEVDKTLLEQLRGDATPVAASPAPPAEPPPQPVQRYRPAVVQAPAAYPPPPPQQRESPALAGIRAAGDSLSRFLYSIAH